MIIDGYGIRLERLKERDIELVRQKRNADHVARYMHFRGEITPGMQQQWYQSVNNIYNLYYIIHTGGQKAGLIYGADIDWEKKETGNGGIFIWDETLWHTDIPFKANLVMLDLSILYGLETCRIKVLPGNQRAIAYNARLGYKKLPGQEQAANQAYSVHMHDYLEHTRPVRQYLMKAYGSVFDIVIDDPEHPVTQFLIERYRAMPKVYQDRLNLIYP